MEKLILFPGDSEAKNGRVETMDTLSEKLKFLRNEFDGYRNEMVSGLKNDRMNSGTDLRLKNHFLNIAGNILASAEATIRQASLSNEALSREGLDTFSDAELLREKTTFASIRKGARQDLSKVAISLEYLEKYFYLLDTYPEFKEKELTDSEGYLGKETAILETSAQEMNRKASSEKMKIRPGYLYIDRAFEKLEGISEKEEMAA